MNRSATNNARSMLVCSFEFGQGQNAEGLCTERLVKGLLEHHWRVTVATSDRAKPTLTDDGLQVLHFSDRPGTVRVAEFLARKLRQYLEPNWVWRRRLLLASPGRSASFIYGRAMPFAGLLAAAALARRLRKPFGIHFSDPYPNVWDEQDFLHAARLRAVNRLVRAAAFVTFVTQEALEFSEQQLNQPLRQKAFVVPHIVPPPFLSTRQAGNEAVFLYAGRFYGRRRPDHLFQGFRLFQAEHPNAVFHYVGPDTEWIQNLSRELGLAASVKTFPFTETIKEHLASADVLVATDANDRQPVFLTTKIMEYLNTNRKVLLVSPPHSPGSKLVDSFPETVVHVVEEPTAIARAMRWAVQCRPSEADFAKRLQHMTSFSAAAIAGPFIEEASSRLKL